jgi:hypothetical protein
MLMCFEGNGRENRENATIRRIDRIGEKN